MKSVGLLALVLLIIVFSQEGDIKLRNSTLRVLDPRQIESEVIDNFFHTPKHKGRHKNIPCDLLVLRTAVNLDWLLRNPDFRVKAEC